MISELRKFQTYQHPCFPECSVTLRFYCSTYKQIFNQVKFAESDFFSIASPIIFGKKKKL